MGKSLCFLLLVFHLLMGWGCASGQKAAPPPRMNTDVGRACIQDCQENLESCKDAVWISRLILFPILGCPLMWDSSACGAPGNVADCELDCSECERTCVLLEAEHQ
jgi:hypothetical protein